MAIRDSTWRGVNTRAHSCECFTGFHARSRLADILHDPSRSQDGRRDQPDAPSLYCPGENTRRGFIVPVALGCSRERRYFGRGQIAILRICACPQHAHGNERIFLVHHVHQPLSILLRVAQTGVRQLYVLQKAREESRKIISLTARYPSCGSKTEPQHAPRATPASGGEAE